MFKKFLRWPFFLLFAVLVLAILIPILRVEHYGIAFAVGSGSANPQITVGTNSITNGQPFQLQVQGFAASEQVQISWDGNGGQFLGILNTDATGSAINCANSDNCILSPPVPAGTYTLTAIGSTSRLQASTAVSTTISLVAAPQNVAPGSTIQVTGSGFPANENLITFFQDTANGTISTKADAKGSFTQPLTLPKTYNPQTSYAVFVEDTQNTVLAKTGFSFEIPSITASASKALLGTKITISGKGFLAHESISLDRTAQHFGPMHIGTATADTSGNFTQSVTLPLVLTITNITLNATGNTSKLQATTVIKLTAISGGGLPIIPVIGQL